MHFWDGIACADSAPKENAAAGEKSERPAEQLMSLDETFPAESKGTRNISSFSFCNFNCVDFLCRGCANVRG